MEEEHLKNEMLINWDLNKNYNLIIY